MPLILQPRDIKILRNVFALRVLRYAQIQKQFFPDNADSAARRRIQALVREGYLNFGAIGVENKPWKYVSVTEKAWSHIHSGWSIPIHNPHFKSESPLHDIRLAEIYFRLKKLTMFDNFFSENLLQSSSFMAEELPGLTIQPDGVLFLQNPAGGIYRAAIEFEITRKSPERYIQKLEAYYQTYSLNNVLYICATQEISNLVARADKEACNGQESIVHTALERDVLNAHEKIFFSNHCGQKVGLF